MTAVAVTAQLAKYPHYTNYLGCERKGREPAMKTARKVFLSRGSKLKNPNVQNQRVPDLPAATLSRSCPRAVAGRQGYPGLGGNPEASQNKPQGAI
jgi:hypothetical protein